MRTTDTTWHHRRTETGNQRRDVDVGSFLLRLYCFYTDDHNIGRKKQRWFHKDSRIASRENKPPAHPWEMCPPVDFQSHECHDPLEISQHNDSAGEAWKFNSLILRCWGILMFIAIPCSGSSHPQTSPHRCSRPRCHFGWRSHLLGSWTSWWLPKENVQPNHITDKPDRIVKMCSCWN